MQLKNKKLEKKYLLPSVFAAVVVLFLGVSLLVRAATGAFQASASASALGATSRSIDVPAGTAAGSVLIAQIVINNSVTSGITAPAGWTLACEQRGNNVSQVLWWRAATDNEPAAYTWKLPANSGVVGNILRYKDIDTTMPIDSCAGRASVEPGLEMTAPALTINGGDILLNAAYGFSGSGSLTPANDFNERLDKHTSKDPAGRAVSSAVADKVSGPCATETCTMPTTTASASMFSGESTPQWVALQYGLVPALSPAPVNTAMPKIKGRPQVGLPLTVQVGSWASRGKTTYSYVWQQCTSAARCTDITDATNDTFKPTTAHLGRTIQVIVTAANSGGKTSVTSASTRPIALFFDDFTGNDGIISNEYAYSHATTASVYANPDWHVTSGCLYRLGGRAITNAPTTVPKNAKATADCAPYNNNNVLRFFTRQSFKGNITAKVSIQQNTDIHDVDCVAHDSCTRGVHMLLRHRTEADTYYVSLNRVDDQVLIKRKVPCGPSNDGTYFQLGAAAVHKWKANILHNYKVTAVDNGSKSVTISLYDLATSSTRPIVTAVDSGGTNTNWSPDCKAAGRYATNKYPPLFSGQVGLRGDYANFSVNTLSVTPN